ncbi:hypothetical protein [Acidilobus sp.]|uniref:hypothetical protein n=1 Tax=Acidilobus sp. TaxID=1872109 RepID=UPI003D04D14D
MSTPLSKILMDATYNFISCSQRWNDISMGEYTMANMRGWTGTEPVTGFQYWFDVYGYALTDSCSSVEARDPREGSSGAPR